MFFRAKDGQGGINVEQVRCRWVYSVVANYRVQKEGHLGASSDQPIVLVGGCKNRKVPKAGQVVGALRGLAGL